MSELPVDRSTKVRIGVAVGAAMVGVFQFYNAIIIGQALDADGAASKNNKDFGDAVLCFVTAVGFVPDLIYPTRLALPLRSFFKKGDRYARNIIFALGIGGTLLAIKITFDTHILPYEIDWIIKRLAYPSVGIAFVIYCVSLLSKIADLPSDESMHRYETTLYCSVMIFGFFLYLLALGTPSLDGSGGGRNHDVDSPRWFNPAKIEWKHHDIRHLLQSIVLISMVWGVYSFASIISRQLEVRFARETSSILRKKKRQNIEPSLNLVGGTTIKPASIAPETKVSDTQGPTGHG